MKQACQDDYDEAMDYLASGSRPYSPSGNPSAESEGSRLGVAIIVLSLLGVAAILIGHFL